MKQQKFFVGDKVVRTQYMGNYEPINGSVAIVTAVELDEEDGNFYLRFKELPSEKWDADYFSIVERVWQENTGVQPVPDGTKVFYQYEGMSPEEHPTDADNLEWSEPASGIIRWRIADEYENPEVLFEQEQPAEAQPPAGVTLGEELVPVETDKFWCETCEGGGTIDETLGGEHFSNRYAKCPDCDGKGYWEKKKMVAEVQKKNKYTREIKPNVFVDVYDVLRAFNVTDPCLSHLAKKALAAGQRHHKDRLTDLQDIKASIERAIEMHKEWN